MSNGVARSYSMKLKLQHAVELGKTQMDTPNGILVIRFEKGVYKFHRYGGKMLYETSDENMARAFLIEEKLKGKTRNV